MNFPLIPLVGFSELVELNVGMSAAIAIMASIFAFICLIVNSLADTKYNKEIARTGLGALALAILISIVGVVYPMVLIAAALVLYVLIYWIIWRFLIKNVIAAFAPDEPESKPKPKSKKK